MVITKFKLFEGNDDFSDFIVGFPSGEVIFVNDSDLSVLEEKESIFYDVGVGKHMFFDDDLDDIQKILSENEKSDPISDFMIKKCGLKKHEFNIREDNSIDIVTNVNISSLEFKHFPYEFGIVNGDFNCGYNNLISLKNSPSYVDGIFKCNNNALHSLYGGPAVTEDYYCGNNFLINLDGLVLGQKSQKLDVRNNNISIIDFKKIPYLRTLILSFNEMKNLNGISKLKKLEVLSCDNNKLENIDDVCNLENLKELYCSWNEIDKLNIGKLDSLECLSCKNNKLNYIEGLEKLTHLKTLSCGDNYFNNDYVEYLKRFCNEKNIKLFI